MRQHLEVRIYIAHDFESMCSGILLNLTSAFLPVVLSGASQENPEQIHILAYCVYIPQNASVFLFIPCHASRCLLSFKTICIIFSLRHLENSILVVKCVKICVSNLKLPFLMTSFINSVTVIDPWTLIRFYKKELLFCLKFNLWAKNLKHQIV